MSFEKLTDTELAALVAKMTPGEKVDLLAGHRMWRTKKIDRLGIPDIVMTDGTYGVRYSIDQIDNDTAGGQDFVAFLSVVDQRADHFQVAWGAMKQATCFPNGSSLGCSWDVDLAYTLGTALATECQEFGVQLLLGPGINLRRTPLAGRAYEYYSEDPVISGDIAAAVIDGLQSNGVGASLKHFACNNSEVERTSMDSIVEERVLREVYLKGFERAVRKSQPWTVMSSYNRLNGEQTAESHWLLTEVLRDDWGFDGLVVSDWHGIKNRLMSLLAGNDLDMPESKTRKDELAAAIEAGTMPMDLVDASCLRVLKLVRKARAGIQTGVTFDRAAHHALARRIARESIVLLKNDGELLPIDPGAELNLLLVGEGAGVPVIQGAGCATTFPTRTDVPLTEITALAGQGIRISHVRGTSGNPDEHAGLIAEAAAAAAKADIVIVFANSEDGYDGEGSDRRHLGLAPGHDALIGQVAAANARTVVVIASPDAVVMPWANDVSSIVEVFYSGQAMGGGLADILFGVVSPSGKLTTTFAKRVEDLPTFTSYPGENGRHLYAEGIYAGYRWYDQREIEPLFPFGHGLSYTTFDYANIAIDRDRLCDGDTLTVSFDLINSGARPGAEVVQLYTTATNSRLAMPKRMLKGFAKVMLAPRETKRVTIAVPAADLAIWDNDRKLWVLDDDIVGIEIASSSRDIRLTTQVQTLGHIPRDRPVRPDTQPVYVLRNPIARKHFVMFLVGKLSISDSEADRMLEHCANSFFGMFTTLDRRFRLKIDPEDVRRVVDAINAEMSASIS